MTWVTRRYERQHGRCAYCQHRMSLARTDAENMATRDHVIPKCRGGGRRRNTVLACKRCNGLKGAMTGREFRAYLAARDPLPPPSGPVFDPFRRIVRTETPDLAGCLPDRLRERAGFDRAAMGLAGAATATLGDFAGWRQA